MTTQCEFPTSMNGPDDSLMCAVHFQTVNALSFGGRSELNIYGMLKATFSVSNKLSTLELCFDVMSIMQQLRRIANRQDFLVIPNTISLACEPNQEARVIIDAHHNYQVLHVNEVSF